MTRRPVIATAVVVALLLAGCGGEPRTSGPAGVDGLEIPTPSPDPADYVDVVDNPWLPLTPGTRWVYRSTVGEPRTTTVTVADRAREVQGVAATVVHERVTGADGRLVEDGYEWFAQDEAGNVWHLGAESDRYDGRGRVAASHAWEAGVDGARAGIAMLAEPRVGDGYPDHQLAGGAGDQVTVLSLEALVVNDLATYDDALQTAATTSSGPPRTEHRYHARGVGLVYAETVAGGDHAFQLVEHTAG